MHKQYAYVAVPGRNHYSVEYFDRVSALEALYHRTSVIGVKGESHMRCVNLTCLQSVYELHP